MHACGSREMDASVEEAGSTEREAVYDVRFTGKALHITGTGGLDLGTWEAFGYYGGRFQQNKVACGFVRRRTGNMPESRTYIKLHLIGDAMGDALERARIARAIEGTIEPEEGAFRQQTSQKSGRRLSGGH